MPIVSYKGPPLTPEVRSSPLQWEVLLVPRPGKAHALPHAEEVPFWQGRPGLQKRLQQGGVVFLFPCDPTVLQARFDLGAALCTEIGNRRPRSQVPARGASPFQAFSVWPDKLDSLAYLPEPGSGKGRVVSDRDDSPPLSTGLPCDWPLAVRTGLQRVCSGRAGAQRGGARHTPACAQLALLSAPGLRLREAPDGLAAAVLFSRGWSGSQRPRGFSFSS